jgi:hypothetical protein
MANQRQQVVVQHSYRLAIYGRPNSGKTCILAALAMMREPHPDGFSCVWICDDTTVPRPDGDPSTWNPDDPRVAAFEGKKWLKEAIRRLEAGDVPRANPTDATPFRFFFDFTTNEGRVLRVEMIDYTGELVNPDLSEDKLAKKLRMHMEGADGVLVLAEAPRPGEEYAPLYRELQRLQQAFMLIAERRRGRQTERFPIALILNKWDRVTRMADYDSAQCEVEARVFLERRPPVPHKTLANVLAAVAGKEEEQHLSRTFGLSAFGKAKTISKATDNGRVNIDVPAVACPLPAFGLEDPFVWLCKSADRVAERELEQSVASLKSWKVWQFFSRTPLSVAAEAKTFSQRFPRKSNKAKKALALRTSAYFAFLKQGAVAACLFFLGTFFCIQGTVVMADSRQMAKLMPAIDDMSPPDPLERLPEWVAAEQFLGTYSVPAWHRWGSHLCLMHPNKASEHLDSLRPRISDSQDLLAAKSKMDNLLAIYQKRIDDLSTPKDALEAITKELDGLVIDQKLRGSSVQRGKLLALVKVTIDNRVISGDKTKIRTEFDGRLLRYNFDDAASLVLNQCNTYPDLKKDLEAEFKRKAPVALRDQALSLSSSGDWNSAIDVIKQFKRSSNVTQILEAPVVSKTAALEEYIRAHWSYTHFSNWRSEPNNKQYQQAVLNYADSNSRKQLFPFEILDKRASLS